MISVIEGDRCCAKGKPSFLARHEIDPQTLLGFLFLAVASSFLRRMLGRFGGAAAPVAPVGLVWLLFSALIAGAIAGLVAFLLSPGLTDGGAIGPRQRMGIERRGVVGGGGGGFSGGGAASAAADPPEAGDARMKLRRILSILRSRTDRAARVSGSVASGRARAGGRAHDVELRVVAKADCRLRASLGMSRASEPSAVLEPARLGYAEQHRRADLPAVRGPQDRDRRRRGISALVKQGSGMRRSAMAGTRGTLPAGAPQARAHCRAAQQASATTVRRRPGRAGRPGRD
jgi:hypothetical protein